METFTNFFLFFILKSIYIMRICVAGVGVVGYSVVRMLNQLRGTSNKRLVAISSLSKKPSIDVPHYTNPIEMIKDRQPDVLVETIGGVEMYDLHCKAFELGIKVVTANKALLAAHPELISKCHFEAAIGGGIPCVSVLRNYMNVANPVMRIEGILNGTSNFILEQMAENNISLEEATILATEAGYAEADADGDIDGVDAANKISILSKVAFNESPKLVHITGIRDVDDARGVKLVASAEYIDNNLMCSVVPVIDHSYKDIGGIGNCIRYEGIYGTVELRGEGAGGNATATAIMGDIAA